MHLVINRNFVGQNGLFVIFWIDRMKGPVITKGGHGHFMNFLSMQDLTAIGIQFPHTKRR